MVRKYKKETIAKNLINGAHDLKDLNYLSKDLGELYDRAKEKREGYDHLMKVYDDLYTEFLDDKIKFVKKYAKAVYVEQKNLQEKFVKRGDIWKKIDKSLKKKSKKIR